jgi:altronate dehydratase large subunit
MLVEQGATVVLSENCELVAAADILAGRAATAEIGARIRRMAEEVNAGYKARFGRTLDESRPKELTREALVKASLAHAAKAGATSIRGFFDMAETVRGPGLVILDGPNTDLESVTALAAAGCNVNLFTTGRGTPVGSPASITLKITATQKTFEVMEENIDLCVAGAGDGSESIDAAAARVVAAIVAAANGTPAKAERLGHWEVAMPIRGVTY